MQAQHPGQTGCTSGEGQIRNMRAVADLRHACGRVVALQRGRGEADVGQVDKLAQFETEYFVTSIRHRALSGTEQGRGVDLQYGPGRKRDRVAMPRGRPKLQLPVCGDLQRSRGVRQRCDVQRAADFVESTDLGFHAERIERPADDAGRRAE